MNLFFFNFLNTNRFTFVLQLINDETLESVINSRASTFPRANLFDAGKQRLFFSPFMSTVTTIITKTVPVFRTVTTVTVKSCLPLAQFAVRSAGVGNTPSVVTSTTPCARRKRRDVLSEIDEKISPSEPES